MKVKLSNWSLGVALALLGSTVPPAMADEWNKETRLVIKQPLELPGKVLTPGIYIFKLADSIDRHIVEVFSENSDGTQTLVTTIFAIAAYRIDTPDRPIINLEERLAGAPQAIHTWFYPGDRDGWEFVYPKAQPLESREAPAAPAIVTLALPDSPLEAVPEPPVELHVDEVAASAPVEEPAVVAVEEPALVVVQAEDTQRILELPTTAGHSSTELLAAVIMLAVGLAIVVAASRKAQA